MSEGDIPSIQDVTKAGEMVTGAIEAINRLFPGIAIGSRSRAESRATERMIRDIEKINGVCRGMDLSDDLTNSLLNDVRRRHFKAENLSSIAETASFMISGDADASEVDGEWADRFRRHAERVTDDEVRRVWAQILAGEINAPGSFSKHTLTVLSEMGRDEVRSFSKVCSLCAGGKNVGGSPKPLMPCIYLDKSGTTYCDGVLSYSEVSELVALGLLDRSSQIFGPNDFFALCVGEHTLFPREPLSNRLLLGDVVFTKSGEELSTLCDVGTYPNLAARLTNQFEKMGVRLFDFCGPIRIDSMPRYLLDLIKDPESRDALGLDRLDE